MQENQRIEFKSSLSNLESILESVVALANNGGGEILIGVDDKGKILGIEIGKNTIENFAQAISKRIIPPVLPEINIEKMDGKDVIQVKVTESLVKPHFFKSIAYKRIGKSNIKLTPQDIESMIQSRLKVRDFDEQLSEAVIEDIDKDAFDKFKALASEHKRIDISGLKDKDILAKLGLIEGGKLKNAAVVLFAKEPARFFPFSSFKCAVSKTSEFDLEQLVDIQNYEKSFFLLVEMVLDYVIRYIPKRVYLEGLVRKEDPVIPVNALREIIVNSLIHRDYQIPSPIYLLITPDFIELRNPGSLYGGLTIFDLYHLHNSVLRNDLLAKVVYNSGYTDKWGSGTIKVIRECGKLSLIPEFVSERNFFKVRIPFKPSEEILKVTGLLKKKRMNSSEVAKKLGIAERTSRKMLSDLVEKEIVRKVREKNKIFYEV